MWLFMSSHLTKEKGLCKWACSWALEESFACCKEKAITRMTHVNEVGEEHATKPSSVPSLAAAPAEEALPARDQVEVTKGKMEQLRRIMEESKARRRARREARRSSAAAAAAAAAAAGSYSTAWSVKSESADEVAVSEAAAEQQPPTASATSSASSGSGSGASDMYEPEPVTA